MCQYFLFDNNSCCGWAHTTSWSRFPERSDQYLCYFIPHWLLWVSRRISSSRNRSAWQRATTQAPLTQRVDKIIYIYKYTYIKVKIVRNTKKSAVCMCSFITHVRTCCLCTAEETILISERPCSATKKSIFGSCGRNINTRNKSNKSLYQCEECRQQVHGVVYRRPLRLGMI
ncbi:hypothetical protein GGR58DRAFT_481795 [Xylaria digitata]|nr:hypothetical protein GGR58DRAFT_481795 [Xylaria digitata]